jgi:hypothetical protein
VITASTPGIAFAASVSIERIVPCACVLRTMTAWAWSGSAMSSV